MHIEAKYIPKHNILFRYFNQKKLLKIFFYYNKIIIIINKIMIQ
jgi:hypothetical protein